MKVLSLKDIQKELDTEKLVSSKVYNEVRVLMNMYSVYMYMYSFIFKCL